MDHLLKPYCIKHHIVLRRGQSLHVLLALLWNKVLSLKLRLHKRLHGVKRPIVHYYAVCWNEERMLPLMFDYYSKFVEKFVIYDNGSTDGSRDMIEARKDSKVIDFVTDGFDDQAHNEIKNKCWKASRGKADFVVVCDMDEFLYQDDLTRALQDMKNNGCTIVRPKGYDMYSETYPSVSRPIVEQVNRGVRNPKYDKCILFDPHAIVEINYLPGAHESHPLGVVKWADNEMKLLHFKNLGLEDLLQRNRLYMQRLSKNNLENEWGLEYLRNEESLASEFHANLKLAERIL